MCGSALSIVHHHYQLAAEQADTSFSHMSCARHDRMGKLVSLLAVSVLSGNFLHFFYICCHLFIVLLQDDQQDSGKSVESFNVKIENSVSHETVSTGCI